MVFENGLARVRVFGFGSRTLCAALLAIGGLTACGGGAASSRETTGARANASSEETISREEFYSAMEVQGAAAACEEIAGVLSSCFNTDTATCRTKYAEETRTCGSQLASNGTIPARIPDTQEAGNRYGQALAECSLQRFFARLDGEGLRSSASECQAPAQ